MFELILNQIDVQVYIVFLAACFFTVLYLFFKLNKKSANWLGIFAAVSWITLGFLWIFLAAESSPYTTYSVSLLFNGFGIFMIVYVVIDLLQIGRNQRELGEAETE